MPRCFKPSLTEALLNRKLAQYNKKPDPDLKFDTTQTMITPDAIRIKFGEQVYIISIDEDSGEPVVAPPGDLAAILLKKIGQFPQSSIRDAIFQHISDINRTGCGDPVAGAAVGGAGGPAAFAPSALLTRSPGASPGEDPSTAAAAHSSPGFEFGGDSPKNPGERKSRRRARSTRRKTRKTRRSTRRYRTKQNRY